MLRQPDNRLYAGRGGSGKSFLALRHVEKFPRVLFIRPDQMEEPPFPYTQSAVALHEAMKAKTFQLGFITDGSLEKWEAANALAIHHRNVAVIWEEAGGLMMGRNLPPHARELWVQGRHVGCRVYASTQMPQRISRDCRSNLARAIVFNTSEPGDLRYWFETTGDPQVRETLRRLDWNKHEAWDWNPGGSAVKTSPFP